MKRRLRVSLGVVVLCLSAGCSSSRNGGSPEDGGTVDLDAWIGALYDRKTPPSDGGDAGQQDASVVSVELVASSTKVTAPGTITLMATASSDKTIGKIEFYENATLLATKNASPATITVGFVEGDNGMHAYTARAYTPSANGTSAAVTVDVSIPPDPCGVDKSACVGAGCAPSSCLAPTHIASGFGAFSRSRGIADKMLSGASTFDTTTGAMGVQRAGNADPTIYEVKDGVGFVRVAQAGNEPPLAIWIFQSATFDGAVVNFSGDGASILAASHDMTVSVGTSFDVSAKGRLPGPGGFFGGTYVANGLGCAFGSGTPAGGGGAGFGTDGAMGGTGVGGPAANCAAYGELVSLRGGSGGGGGDDSSSAMDVRFGGAGGGALQLSALGNLKFDGTVAAGGGGGRTSEGNWRSGAGGGSGGAIYLESPSITLGASAGLYANGGGGGSTSPGTGGSCASPAASQDGQTSLIPAKGSHCGTGYGGNGAASMVAATNGTGNGGGGGGLGRIIFRTLPSSTPAIATSSLSPDPSSSSFRVLNTLGQ